MSDATLSTDSSGRLVIEGDLSFASVPEVWRNWRGIGPDQTVLDVDLSKVRRSDSAGLALLVECLRQARDSGGDVRFLNMPAQMLEIARVSGLDAVLPLHRD